MNSYVRAEPFFNGSALICTIQRILAMGNITTYEYDLMDRCIKVTNALGKSEKYVYDKNGRLKEVTDREGNITFYQYDKAGRLIKEKKGLLETTIHSF